MQIKKYETEEEWLDARRGRITGTRLKDIEPNKRSGKPKTGLYEILAERVAVPPNGENVMYRGQRLESEALQKFAQKTGKVVIEDRVIWHRDDDENIAISPDGYMETTGAITEACEVKCLSSAKHIQAWCEQQIPDEYLMQALQYFIVNDDLQTLFFIFYDPRMPKDLFWIEIPRDQEKVDEYLELERTTLIKIADLADQLTF